MRALQRAPLSLKRSVDFGYFAAMKVQSFFASSTDHTFLLHEAQVHRLLGPDKNCVQYVMAAVGIDMETVKKVPQLHLARILVSDNRLLHSAKVINRTLGEPEHVCGRLVDAALADIPGVAMAKSTLHGLSQWVLDGSAQDNDSHPARKILKCLNATELAAVIAIASGNYLDEIVYDSGRESWEKLATMYANHRMSPEIALYISKGATLESIQHNMDIGDYANTCGGAMAFLKF
jgi:hypothetical protein